jgi:hypothetical protein
MAENTPLLDAYTVEALARRVVEIMREERDAARVRRLVDAATLAVELGVKRSWVYERRELLGAVRLGVGSKPRLRFDLLVAREALARHRGSPSAPVGRAPGGSNGSPARRQRHRTGRVPAPGSVLVVRARRAT